MLSKVSISPCIELNLALEVFVAVPKKRTSVSRKGLRWAGHTFKIHAKPSMKCPNCGDYTLPLKACPSCGQYKGKSFIPMKAVEEQNAQSTSGDKV